MALPQDGQNANGLTKVTQIPAGKELMFIDPTTNEGGIITLEDLTKQILNGLASQAFALDAGQMTLPAALNYLYGNRADAGTATFGASTEEKRIEKITFKRPFHEIPKVVATYAENNAYNYGREICVYNISTTGFTAETFISLSGATLAFNWVAVCSK